MKTVFRARRARPSIISTMIKRRGIIAVSTALEAGFSFVLTTAKRLCFPRICRQAISYIIPSLLAKSAASWQAREGETMTSFPYGFPTNYSRYLSGTDLKWPSCTNAEPGSMGHECGQPARYIAQTVSGFAVCYCAACKATGTEAVRAVNWMALPPAPCRTDGTHALTFEAARRA